MWHKSNYKLVKQLMCGPNYEVVLNEESGLNPTFNRRSKHLTWCHRYNGQITSGLSLISYILAFFSFMSLKDHNHLIGLGIGIIGMLLCVIIGDQPPQFDYDMEYESSKSFLARCGQILVDSFKPHKCLRRTFGLITLVTNVIDWSIWASEQPVLLLIPILSIVIYVILVFPIKNETAWILYGLSSSLLKIPLFGINLALMIEAGFDGPSILLVAANCFMIVTVMFLLSINIWAHCPVVRRSPSFGHKIRALITGY